ncbi:MAG: hypothetical protein KDC03_22865, partial [Flavobacteriales bacterium]|nr:hypothetical protein [Flavobacteriales bacterium]
MFRTAHLLALSIPLLAPTILSAQGLIAVTPWQTSLQEIAYDVAVDSEGATVTVGTFTSALDLDPGPGVFTVTPNGSSDIFICKLSASGGFLWGGSLGGGNADLALSVVTDASDNVVLTGRVAGTLDVDPGPGVQTETTLNTTYDVLVMKLSSGGSLLWAHVLGSNNNDVGRRVAVDANGNIAVTGVLGAAGDVDPGPGTTLTGGNGQDDVLVLKFDAAGGLLWGFAIGGPANDAGNGVAIDASGNVLVTGEYRNTMDLDPGAGANAITSNGNTDLFVAKYDGSGNLLWGHGMGGTSLEFGAAVATGPSGQVAITGQFNSATDVDPGPGSLVLPASGTEDAFLLQLDASGALEWAFLLKSFLNRGRDLVIDGGGHVVLAGTFGSTLDADPGPGVANLVSHGASDGFVLGYDAAGQYQWGFHVGGPANDIIHGLDLGIGQDVFVAGEFQQTMDAEPGPGVTAITSLGGQDAFMARYARPGCPEVELSLRVLLDGPYDEGLQLMHDSLRAQGLLPVSEPYTGLGFTPGDPLAAAPGILGTTGPDAIVDWLLVELRDAAQPANVIGSRVALVQRDGDVVAPDGASTVRFCDPGTPVHVAVRHRNHLGV